MNEKDNTLLRVQNLRTYFNTEDGAIKAVDGVSFKLEKGKVFALVGESGCGKSVTAFSILRLLQMPPAMITSHGHLTRQAREIPSLSRAQQQSRLAVYRDCLRHGRNGLEIFDHSSVTLEGMELLDLSETQMRQVRGGQISMIFQEPMSSLNPVYTCGSQIVEAIRLHRKMSGRDAHQLAVDMLAQVGIPDPSQRFHEYPHQLSGGMRQRVMIAMALSCNPRLLIADEPTTALDVTIQAQILDLLKNLQQEVGLSILLITHDLAVVAETADVVAVMYASNIVELADVKTLFANPLHPYTQGLFRSVPRLGQKKARLETIAGTVPNPLNFPAGCKFNPRCGTCQNSPECIKTQPPLREVEPGHWVACWKCPNFEQAPQTDPSA